MFNRFIRWPGFRSYLNKLIPKDNLALFVDPGTQMIDNARANHRYPALLTGQEQADNPDFHDFTIDYPSVGEPNPFYESDFKDGTDGWIAVNGTNVGNTDGIGGEDDVLKFYASSDNAVHYIYKLNTLPSTEQYYKVTGKIYIPSSNTTLYAVRVMSASSSEGKVTISAKDSWVDFELEIDHNITDTALRFYGLDNTSAAIWTGAGSSSDDIFYVKDIKVQRVGLVAWWQFDSYYHAQEGTGKTILQDLSGNGYDLTASGGFDYTNQLIGDDPTYKNGNALEFDGVDDRFSNEGSAFQPGSSNFSALVWFKTAEPAGAYHVLMETYDGASANWQLMIDPSAADLRITITDGTNTQTLLGDPVNDNNWHLGILVRDGNTFYLYDNATVVASWTGTMGSLSNTNELSIGMRNGGTLGFVGNIATAAYFNRALSATEVQALYGKPKYWTWNETGSIANNNFKAELSGGAELSQDITTDDETLYKEQKISTTANNVDYFGNTTSHTITIGDGTWTYAGVKDVTNVSAPNSTTVIDYSGNGNNGMAQGGLETNQPVYPYAWEFDGVDDYVDFGDATDLVFSTHPFIINVWMTKPNTLNTKPFANKYNYEIIFDGTGEIKYYLYGVTSSWESTGIDIPSDNNFHLFSWVYDPDIGSKFYWDGELVSSDTINKGNSGGGYSNFTIGAFYDGSSYGSFFDGKIALYTFYHFDGQNGRASVMPSNYVDHYIKKIYNNTERYFK